MATNTIQYSPAAVVLTVGGKRIQDFVKDSFLELTFVQPEQATFQYGATGTAAVSLSSIKGATLKIVVMQGSRDNATLSTFMAKQIGKAGSGPVTKLTVSLYNSIDGSTISGDGFMKSLPTVGYGVENGTRDWMLEIPQGLSTFAEKAA